MLDRCLGCGSCMIAAGARQRNNVPALPQATARTGLTANLGPQIVERDGGQTFVAGKHCSPDHVHALREHETPCMHVYARSRQLKWTLRQESSCRCPNAVWVVAIAHDSMSVSRAIFQLVRIRHGQREMEKSLNPGIATRMRGVVEKCNLCRARFHSAKEKAAGCWKARNRRCRLHSSMRRSLPDPCDFPDLETWPIRMIL